MTRFGIENRLVLVAFYDHPPLMHRINVMSLIPWLKRVGVEGAIMTIREATDAPELVSIRGLSDWRAG